MDEYIKREALKRRMNFDEQDIIKKDGKVFVNFENVKIAVENTPAADVVPKSEVDRVYQRGFERGKRDNVYGFSAEDIAQKCENLAIELEAMRAEVAREIFEEIEKWLGNYNGCRVITYERFAKLKKKYTEEEK